MKYPTAIHVRRRGKGEGAAILVVLQCQPISGKPPVPVGWDKKKQRPPHQARRAYWLGYHGLLEKCPRYY